jgi:hypothetical protein
MAASQKSGVELTPPRRGATDRDALLEAATKNLYRNNAFRITGLPVDATPREISRHGDRIKMLEELGGGKIGSAGAFARTPPPTLDEIRAALQRLKDPEKRLVDEFFWFWPEEFGNGQRDPALMALAAGKSATAQQIWAAKEKQPTGGAVAIHNVAVMWHITALESESVHASRDLTEEAYQKLQQYWKSAIKRWTRLANDDTFWALLSGRIQQIDDARLTTGVLRRMRTSLPQALGKVNAELALSHAEAGRLEIARLHVQMLREITGSPAGMEKTAEMVLAPAKSSLREVIQRTKLSAEQTPEKADQAVRDLIAMGLPLIGILELFFGKQPHPAKELLDESALACLNCLIAFHKKTGDDKTVVNLLERSLPLAQSDDVRQRVLANIATGKANLDYAKLEPVHQLLQSVQNSTALPAMRLAEFNRTVRPKLEEVVAKIASSSAVGANLIDEAAATLRGISLDAWNKHKDVATASAAIEVALRLPCDPELKKRLHEDKTALAQFAAQIRAKESARKVSLYTKLFIGAGIVIWIVIASIHQQPSAPAPASYRPPAPAAANHGDTYFVPNDRSAELNRDSQEIDAAKDRAEALSHRVDSMSREIEQERPNVDLTNQGEIDAFNQKVAVHNDLVKELQTQNQWVNDLVDKYNAKLRQYGR